MAPILIFDFESIFADPRWKPPRPADSLEVIRNFRSPDGTPPRFALTLASCDTRGGFLRDLERLEVRDFFEPVGQAVLVSGESTTERLDCLKKLLSRLGVSAEAEAVLITNSKPDLKLPHVRSLQLSPPRMKATEAWPQLPLRWSRSAAVPDWQNIEAALKHYLRSCHDLEDARLIRDEPGGGLLHARARAWDRLEDSKIKLLDGVLIQLPVQVDLHQKGDGPVTAVEIRSVSSESRLEAGDYLESLIANQQIQLGDEPLPGATHQLVTGPGGQRRLIRKGYSLLSRAD